MELAGIRAVAFVNKADDAPLALESLGQRRQKFLAVQLDVGVFSCIVTIFMNQRADDVDFLVVGEDIPQIIAASGTMYFFSHANKDTLDLIVQFLPVGDNHHAAVRDIFHNPFGEPHHDEGFAGALGVPDDAALPGMDTAAGGDVSKILIMPHDFLMPRIENYKVISERQKSLFLAKGNHAPVEAVLVISL